jgi:hypothetical protein
LSASKGREWRRAKFLAATALTISRRQLAPFCAGVGGTRADLDINRPLILSGDLDAVRSDIAIKSILDLLDKYGPAITDRLWHHVEFVLENRKKYFEAVSRHQ